MVRRRSNRFRREGAGENITGIKGYKYRLDEVETGSQQKQLQEKTYTFHNKLEQGSTHTVYMESNRQSRK